MAAKLTDVIDTEKLTKMFDLPDWDKIESLNEEYLSEPYSSAYKQAVVDGASEEEAEKAGLAAEEEARDELFGNWHDAVVTAAENLFEKHGLKLEPRRKKEKFPFEFRILPEKSWEDAADKIRETINGVGYFHFNDLKEFLDSGPYTARQAVFSHIGYVNDYPAVYGSRSARGIFESAWR